MKGVQVHYWTEKEQNRKGTFDNVRLRIAGHI